jgi:hypothetical protein
VRSIHTNEKREPYPPQPLSADADCDFSSPQRTAALSLVATRRSVGTTISASICASTAPSAGRRSARSRRRRFGVPDHTVRSVPPAALSVLPYLLHTRYFRIDAAHMLDNPGRNAPGVPYTISSRLDHRLHPCMRIHPSIPTSHYCSTLNDSRTSSRTVPHMHGISFSFFMSA